MFVDEIDAADGVAGLHDGLSRLLDPGRDLDEHLELMDARELLDLVRQVEVARRRFDAVRVAVAGAVERSGAHGVDGHRSAKAALVHLGRLSGAEAHRLVHTARALRRLPQVDKGFRAGEVPTEMAHALSRAVSNPRVRHLLDVADPIFAEQASSEVHDAFVAWLGEWERLADADGAEQGSDDAHRHRGVSLVQNQIDGSWLLRGQFGALQGAALADALAVFLAAEDSADRSDAVARVGPAATPADWARSAQQRRADALLALVRQALANAPGGRRPEPLINIVIDQSSFEEMLASAARGRRAPRPEAERDDGSDSDDDLDPDDGSDSNDGHDSEGGRSSDDGHGSHDCHGSDDGNGSRGSHESDDGQDSDSSDDPFGIDGRICATTSGHTIHPSDALAAALVGYVRRVVVDGDGRVINLGRSQRLFTGGARDAAELQAAIAARGPTGCLWSGCSASRGWLEADHNRPWHRGGRTDQDNANLLCGHHNRLKETGYRPVRGPDGQWQLLRPDGTTITPPI